MLSILRRRWISIVLLGALGLIAATILANNLPEIYVSTAKLVLETDEPQLFEAVPEMSSSASRVEAIETELQIMNSRLLAGRVVDKLDLKSDPFYNHYLGSAQANAEASDQGSIFQAIKEFFGGSEAAKQGRVRAPSPEEVRDAVISRYLAQTNVVRSGQSSAVNFQATHSDARTSAMVANATAEEYLRYSTEKRRESTGKAIRFLTQLSQSLAGEVSTLEQNIVNFKIEHRIDDVQYLASLRAELEQLKVQKSLIEGRSDVPTDAAARDLAEVEAELQQKTQELTERNQAEVALRQMQRELDADKARYEQVVTRLGNLDLQAEPLSQPGNIVSEAQVPDFPTSPKRKVIAIGGLMGGILLAALYILLREGTDNFIRSETDVSRITALPVFGVVPEVKEAWWKSQQAPHEYLKEKPLSQYADAIRQLVFACRTFGSEDSARVVLVASCLPNEGKTTTALSISHQAADEECRTVLLDLDTHKTGVRRTLGISGCRSLHELLAGECELDEAIYQSPENPMLDIIAFSRTTETGESVLDRKAFGVVIEQLKKRYDLIIIDTPPILVTGTAAILTRFATLGLVMVRWGEINSDTLSSGLKKFQQFAPIPIALAINRVNYDKQSKMGYDTIARYQSYAKAYYQN